MTTTVYIPLFAGEYNTNNTNNEWDGEYRTLWPYGTPNPFDSGRLEVGVEFEDATTESDFILRNFTASSDVVSTGTVGADSESLVETFDPTDISPGDAVGLRIDNITASGAAGTEAHAVCNLVLIP